MHCKFILHYYKQFSVLTCIFIHLNICQEFLYRKYIFFNSFFITILNIFSGFYKELNIEKMFVYILATMYGNMAEKIVDLH